MSLWRTKRVGLLVFIFAMLFAVGCGKKQVAVQPPPPPPPPPPAAPTPTITLRAQPATIDRGGSTTLNWEARNAATVTISPEVGNVPVTGNRSVTPASSVTYMATATGPGGSTSDVARVTVNVPPPPPEVARPEPRPPVTNTAIPFDQGMKDVLFDYDKADIKPDMMPVLQGNATYLKNNPTVRFTIEGHCDERGSEEYNLGLGDRRANAVKEYLVGQGIPANRMMTVSYGEERPVCRDETDSCFERNRRAHFAQN